MGDVDLSGLNVLALDLRADVGDIDLENCTLETSTLDANVGDIDLEDCTFTSMELPVMWEMSISIARKTCPVTI